MIANLSVKSIISLAFVAVLVIPCCAQQVHVFNSSPGSSGGTNIDNVSNNELNQKVLFIPVVSSDFAGYDPNNNLFETMFPGFRTGFINKATTNNNVWLENSYGKVSFQSDVLDRVYQLPKELEFYVNPDYIAPALTGSTIDAVPITPLNGMFQLTLRINASDQTTIPITFNGTTSYASYNALAMAIATQVSAIVSDKLTVTLSGGSSLKFEVKNNYVSAGTFVRLDIASSNASLLDQLGLTRPEYNYAGREVTSVGAAYPVTTTGPANLTFQFENETQAPVDFTYNIPPTTTYNNPNAFIAAFGSRFPELTLSSPSGSQIKVTLNAGTLTSVSKITITGHAALLDALGFAASVEDQGVIGFAARNTVSGDRRLLCGQALAAWLIDDVRRNHPGVSFSAANESTIRTTAQNLFDQYRSIAVIIMDVPAGKRAGASNGIINLGVDNSGYTFTFQTYANIQILYGYTTAEVISHEVGHNIGFWDLYDNGGGNYDPRLKYLSLWDIMDNHLNLSHTGAWHKEIIADWFDLNGINHALFPEPPATGTEVRRFVLTPIEMDQTYDNNLQGIPAGRTVTKAIQVVLGLTDPEPMQYLFIQNRQRGNTFSQNLPGLGGMIITDCLSPRSYDFFRPESRNVEHILTDRPLAAGQVQPTVPGGTINLLSTYPAYDGIDVGIVGQIAGPAPFADRPSYLVDVTREQKQKLDLAITPWGAPPYQSVDIWVEHNDGSLSATPLANNGDPTRWSPTYNPAANGGKHLNLIRVKVRNNGTIDATNVTIRVKVNQPGGMGDSGQWVVLGITSPQNIPKGGDAIFDMGWSPKVNAHTCIRAEVWRHDSPLSDINRWNDAAQENVTSFNPTSSSPWRDEYFEFDLTNSRAEPMWVEIHAKNLPKGYSVDLNDEFTYLEGKTTKRITGVMKLDTAIVPVPGSAVGGLSAKKDIVRYQSKTETFHLEAFVVGGEYRLPIGGITYLVTPSVNLDISVSVSCESGWHRFGHGDY